MLAKEVMLETGISKKGLEYYEEKKLLKPQRTASNYRDYSPDDIIIIKKIMLLRTLNFTIEEITTIFNTPSHSVFDEKRQQIERNIYNEQTNLLYLNQCVELFNESDDILLDELIDNIQTDRQVKQEWIHPRFWQRHSIGLPLVAFGIGIALTLRLNIFNYDIATVFLFAGICLAHDTTYNHIYLFYQEMKQKFMK